MNCALCPKDVSPLCLVPKLDATSDWSGDQLVCRECALRQGVYCTIHERPHIYYFGLGTACLWCINEKFQEMARTGDADAIYQRIITGLPYTEVERVKEWTEDMFDDAILLVLRSVVQLSYVGKCSTEEVIQRILQSQSADSLVPAAY